MVQTRLEDENGFSCVCCSFFIRNVSKKNAPKIAERMIYAGVVMIIFGNM